MDGSRTWAPRLLVVAGAAAGAVGLVLAGVLWGGVIGVREAWFWADPPWGVSRVGLHRSELLAAAAQVVLLVSWLGLGALVRRGVARTGTVIATAVAGGVPLLAGAPLFSNDAYTYVAVGNLLVHGLDPYRVGWGALHDASYAGHVDHTWQQTSSPYSPVVLRLLELDARVVHGHLLAGVVVLRVAAVIALVALGVAIARAVRLNRAVRPGGGAGPEAVGPRATAVPVALWISVANPVVTEHLLSGVHIDLYVALLAVLAVGLHTRGRPVAATVLVVLAAQVKVTAAVVLLVLAADVGLRGHPGRRGWRHAGVMLAGGLAAFAATSVATGLGFGWLGALSVPGQGGNSMTPVNGLGDVVRRLGLLGTRPLDYHVVPAVTGLRLAGLMVALGVVVWACLSVRRLGVPLASAAALSALATFGAATWPWYFTPVLALVAIAPPSRRVLTAATLGSAALAVALKPGSEPLLPHDPVAGDLATLALLAGVLAVLAVPGLVSRRAAGRAGAVTSAG